MSLFARRLAECGIEAVVLTRPIGVVHMTPEVAEQLLARTPQERLDATLPTLVRKYTEDFRSGLWPFTADTIKLNDLGHQVDGTHRLLAVQASGWDGPMALALDVPTDAGWVMDHPGTSSSARGSQS